MRQKKEAVLCFASNDDGLPKVVRNYRARYRTISQVLDDNNRAIAAAHAPWMPMYVTIRVLGGLGMAVASRERTPPGKVALVHYKNRHNLSVKNVSAPTPKRPAAAISLEKRPGCEFLRLGTPHAFSPRRTQITPPDRRPESCRSSFNSSATS